MPPVLPPVVRRIGDFALFVRFEVGPKLDRPRVGLPVVIGLFRAAPVHPAVEMSDDPDLDEFLFVIAQGDFEGFVNWIQNSSTGRG